jgi:signal transduction histidine kinase/uncharacterized protein YoaH (UPF0181 family)
VGRDVTERGMANAELGALHRVATLAAEGVAPSDLFAVVAEEVSRVVDVPRVSVARYEPDGTATDCASFPPSDPITSVDRRWSLVGTNVLGLVRTTCAPARIDDYSGLDGEIAARVRSIGIQSTVGVPIVAAGRLWGAMMVSTRENDKLPKDTAARLAKFTELLATAIANAESREALRRLADEQAALRRVATLVASGVDPTEVFSAVAEELAGVLGVQNASVWRYEPDGAATLLAARDEPGATKMPVGKRFTLEGDNIAAMVLRTGGIARMDTHGDAAGSAAAEIRELGLCGGVGAPIIVAGRLWGAAIVGTSQFTPLPPDTEMRVGDFAELVATAIANAATRAELQASRDELRAIADQQAALRRVATLVAREVAPTEVFSAVTAELARRLEVHHATLFRYESDGTATLLAARHDGGSIEAAVGQRFSFQGDNLARLVFDTGRAARIDSHDNASGEAAANIRQLGIRSAVGAPIIVGDRLWGVAIVGSSRPQPLPPDTESRVGDFTDLVATAIANAQTRADLSASRARIVAAADEARRRIERDLHDGAQQRLVALGLELRAAEACVPDQLQPLKQQISRLVTSVAGVSAEVQEISRGIHPAILSRGGLGPALKTLARRSTVPVDLDLGVDCRLADSVEVAAYYVVAEALTNAAKHARASLVDVRVEVAGGNLRLTIQDNGIGGADTGRGSGLTGLTDRIEALGGKMTISSQPGQGTALHAHIPLHAH